jgi:hypothetical protein
MRQWGEARDSGAERLVAYCATCLLLLHMGRIIRPTRMPLYHLMEVLMQAAGEESPHQIVASRARYIFTHIMAKGIPRMLSPKRVKL